LKISDDELLQAIWIAQLKRVALGVLENYIGGTYGVCDDREFDFEHSTSLHRCNRECITDRISKAHMLGRIRKLCQEKRIKSHYGDDLLTFGFTNAQMRAAFDYSRKFWLDNGVPTGYDKENQCMRTANLDNKTELFSKLVSELESKYLTWS